MTADEFDFSYLAVKCKINFSFDTGEISLFETKSLSRTYLLSRLYSPWVIGFESSHIHANSVSVKTCRWNERRCSLKWRSGCLAVRFSVVCYCDRDVGGKEEHISTSLRHPKQTALWRLELLSVRTKIPQLPRSQGILLLSFSPSHWDLNIFSTGFWTGILWPTSTLMHLVLVQ